MAENDSQSLDLERLDIEGLLAFSTKAELYVVSLTFSILALSVQFPIEVTDAFVLRLQAVGWFLMMISGAAGVKLLRNVSAEYSLKFAKYKSKHRGKAFVTILDEWLLGVSTQGIWLVPAQGYCLFFGIFFCGCADNRQSLDLVSC
jgi:hypothetical protein